MTRACIEKLHSASVEEFDGRSIERISLPDGCCLDLKHFLGMLIYGSEVSSVSDSSTLIQRPVMNSIQLANGGDHSILM